MILGLYLVGRLLAVMVGMMLLIFAIVIWLAWQLLCAVGHLLMQPETWAPRAQREARQHRRRSPHTHTGPRNERLYYSNRR